MSQDYVPKKMRAQVGMPICPVCKKQFQGRAKRHPLVKLLLSWTSLRRYYCANCFRCYYVMKPKYLS